jgi:hypothetical protein
MSYLTCPDCGLAILLCGAHPLGVSCPRCRCRCTSPDLAAARLRSESSVDRALAKLSKTNPGYEPGTDRLLKALRGNQRLRRRSSAADLLGAPEPPPGAAA